MFISCNKCMCVCCVHRGERKTKRTGDLHHAVEEEEEEETAPEKRLRLAKEYLAQLEEEGEVGGATGLWTA